MKSLLIILLALQVFFNNTLEFAHMAVDPHDPHEQVHVHAGAQSTADLAIENLGTIVADSDHDDGAHFHLCAIALNRVVDLSSFALTQPSLAFDRQFANNLTAPPVPPPNA